MNGLWAVLRREYLQRVRSRWFLVATLGAPLLFGGMMLVPILYGAGREKAQRTLVVVDETGVLFEQVSRRLQEAGLNVRQGEAGKRDSLATEVLEGRIGGLLWLGPEALRRGRVVWEGKAPPGLIRGVALRDAVVRSVLEQRLGEVAGSEELAALLSGGELEIRLLEKVGSGVREGEPAWVGAFSGAMLLYMVILFYAVSVMRATLEEKTNRIVEILVSSVRPWELMLGKILGVGSVGLTQLAVWLLCGALLLTLGLPAVAVSRPDFFQGESLREALPGPALSALFVGLFLGGYFLYSALYAAVGAMCSTEEEAQQAQLPITLLLVAPILFLMPILENPASPLAVGASLVPFFTPVLMYARAGLGGVPQGEVALGVALLFASVPMVAWFAGRIYRVGILMQGKRPTLPELWRWVRQG